MPNTGGSSTQQMQVPPELRQGLANITSIGSNLFYNQPEWAKNLPSTYVGPSGATQSAIDHLSWANPRSASPQLGAAQEGLANQIGSTPVAGTAGLEGLARGENSIVAPGQNPFQSSIANLSGAASPYTGQIGNLTSSAADYASRFEDMTGQANPYTAQLAGLGGPTTRGTSLLEETASGSRIGGNPELDAMFDRAAGKVTTATKNALNTRGLAGTSPRLETAVLADKLGGLASDFYGRAYETDTDRALAAGGQLANISLADQARGATGLGQAAGLAEGAFGRDAGLIGTAAGLAGQGDQFRLGALGTAAGLEAGDRGFSLDALRSASGLAEAGADRGIGVQGANIANQMAATGQLGNMQSQLFGDQRDAISMLPGLAAYGDRWMDQRLAGGALTEGYQQSAADDYRDRFEGDRTYQWDLANRYANLLGLGGSIAPRTTTTKENPGLFDWLGLL